MIDFRDRFKGKTTIITKEGIEELIATRGIPIKNPFSNTFSRTSYMNYRTSSNIKPRIDPSKSPEKDTTATNTKTIDPKALGRLRIRPVSLPKRDESLPHNEQLVQSSHREGDSANGLNITRNYKSLSNTERRVLTTQPTDESRTSPGLMEKPENIGEGSSNILTQTNAFATQATEADHDREEYPCIYKKVTFIEDNHEIQEQEQHAGTQSAVQRIYRSILKSQEGGFRQRCNTMDLDVQRVRSEEPKEPINRDMPLVRSQTHKEAERPGSSSFRHTNRSLSLINSYRSHQSQSNESKVPRINIEFTKWQPNVNTFYHSNFMHKFVRTAKTERRPLSMDQKSPELIKIKGKKEEKGKQQVKPVNPVGKLKFISIKAAIIPKLKDKIFQEKYKSVSHRGEVSSS